jgi:hypothetical protein
MNDTTPMATVVPNRSLKSSGSTSAPARKVRTMKEGRDEVEPLLRVEVEDVAHHDPQAELYQRDRQPELDRQHAGNDNGGGENGG